MTTLLAALRSRTQGAVGLISPKQDISLTYGEIDDQVRRVARGLREIGVGSRHVVASDAPNTAENLILQLAVSHLGATFATAKDSQSLKEKAKGEIVCTVASNSESWLADRKSLPDTVRHTVVLDVAQEQGTGGQISFHELARSAADSETSAAAPDGLLASYNGSAMTEKQAMALAQSAAEALGSTASDRTCVSITLCHSFGFGSGVGSALLRGGAVVLPAAGGIRGCGDPKQRASVTAEVLSATESSLLFADVPILKQLKQLGGEALAAQLRGGIVKTGSGTDIFDDGSDMEYAGAKLFAMGKKPQ